MASTRNPHVTVRPAPRRGDEGAAARPGRDERLRLYRSLATVPWLSSYRAKLFAVVLLAWTATTFVLLLALVLGAGRMSLLSVFALVIVLAAVGVFAALRAIDRLLAPLELATRAIDDVALGRPLERVDLPGSDDAAQVLRGVQALLSRIEQQDATLHETGDRDALTGLWNRRSGRERVQALIERETRRGLEVRVVVVDVDAFAAFNSRHGAGHGDALLKAVAARLARVAGEGGVAARWSGDAFLLAVAQPPDESDDIDDVLGRPIVVKGSDQPVTLSRGVATAVERVPVDALIGEAESNLAQARVRRRGA